MIDHAPTHTIVYGDSGAGKTTFASTYPKPALVFAFDPFDKATPYLKRGEAKPYATDERGTPVREVYSKKTGALLIRVEWYVEGDLTAPEAYARFLARLKTFQDEYDAWKTCVIDSVTFMELTARKWHQYRLNPKAKEPRQWFAGSTDLVEEMLMGRFATLPMNVIVISHVDEDKDEMHGTFVRSPKMPGQRLRKGVMAGYGELYRAYVGKYEDGSRAYLLQTRSDAMWNAASQITAPDPCEQQYAALWADAQ